MYRKQSYQWLLQPEIVCSNWNSYKRNCSYFHFHNELAFSLLVLFMTVKCTRIFFSLIFHGCQACLKYGTRTFSTTLFILWNTDSVWADDHTSWRMVVTTELSAWVCGHMIAYTVQTRLYSTRLILLQPILAAGVFTWRRPNICHLKMTKAFETPVGFYTDSLGEHHVKRSGFFMRECKIHSNRRLQPSRYLRTSALQRRRSCLFCREHNHLRCCRFEQVRREIPGAEPNCAEVRNIKCSHAWNLLVCAWVDLNAVITTLPPELKKTNCVQLTVLAGQPGQRGQSADSTADIIDVESAEQRAAQWALVAVLLRLRHPAHNTFAREPIWTMGTARVDCAPRQVNDLRIYRSMVI